MQDNLAKSNPLVRRRLVVTQVSVNNVFAHGHPILLVAIANYLREKNWRFATEEIDELVQGKHAHAIAGETLTRLVNSVADEQSRNLLYRLKLVIGEFSSGEIDAVASVVPEIDRALERLRSMTGLWVQCESRDRYVLSPPIRALPETNLTEGTRRDVHLALGARLVRKRVLDPTDLLHAIMHFHGAGHVNYAAALLMNGLRTVLEKGELGDTQLLLLVWGDMPVPSPSSTRDQSYRGHAPRCASGAWCTART